MRGFLFAFLFAVASCGTSSSSSTLPTNTSDAITTPAAEPGQLVDALLGESPAAAWSPTEKRAVFQTTYREEGSGSGLSITFSGVGGTGDSVEVYTPGQDIAAGTAAARPQLVERLTGKGYQMMEYTAWPDGAASMKLPTGADLTWDGAALASAGKQLTSIPPEDPHKPAPTGVFSLAGASTIVFIYVMDPGEAYVEGFNVFNGAQVLAL